MSVYKPKRGDGSYRTSFWHYDFQLKINGESRRFHGSTGQKSKRKAEKVEERIRYLAALGELTSDMTLALACHKYYQEVAILQPSADDTAKALEHCCRLIGGAKLLVEITAADIADAVRRRAAEFVPSRRKRPITKGEIILRKLVTPATVNRQIVETLKRVLRRAATLWDIPVRPDKIPWRELSLREAGPRKREFIGDECIRFWRAMRPDYWPLSRFYLITGLRVSAAIRLRKDEHLDLANKRMHVRLKSRDPGGRWKWMPLSDEAMAILATESSKWDGPEVWTYVRQRRPEKGSRAPITSAGFRRVFDAALRAAKISNFRRHDLRHDFASKLLRATRDLPLVKEALGHADIASTMIYVEVLDETVRDGLNQLSGTPEIVPKQKIRAINRGSKNQGEPED